jgi:hypothetical protein
MIQWLWVPFVLASPFVRPSASSGNQTAQERNAMRPLAAGAGLVRGVEALAHASLDTVLEIHSALCEVQSSPGELEQASVTFELSVHATSEAAARDAFVRLGRHLAARPWRGEEAEPEYARWVQTFCTGSSSRAWTPGHTEERELVAAVAVRGLVTFVLDARDVVSRRLDIVGGRDEPDPSRGVEAVVLGVASNPRVAIGQVSIRTTERSLPEGLHERVYSIHPVGERFTRLQIANLVFLLDADGLGRVTRVELRPAGAKSDAWTFELDYTLVGT